MVSWEKTCLLVCTITGYSCITLSLHQGLKPKFLLKHKTLGIS